MNKLIAKPFEAALGASVGEFIELTKKHVKLALSPKRTEFRFCGLLAVWEAVSRRDPGADQSLTHWREECVRFHSGKPGRTLADPIERQPTPVPESEKRKAYSCVLTGLRHVHQQLLAHYSLDAGTLADGSGPAACLFQKTAAAFKTGKSLACPEGLAMYLLTHIETLERSFDIEPEHTVTHQLWIDETRRRRVGGNPETRTLADVASPSVRLAREAAYPAEERVDCVLRMLGPMHRIASKLKKTFV